MVMRVISNPRSNGKSWRFAGAAQERHFTGKVSNFVVFDEAVDMEEAFRFAKTRQAAAHADFMRQPLAGSW